MKEFYGIDLGTTYSCIATIDSDDIVTVIPNGASLTTPSVVAFDDDGKLLVGKPAKNNLGNKPENTVALIKREMSNKEFTRTIFGKTYDPVEISSFILKYLVDYANQKRKDEEGKDPIYRVVITVPAYFGNAERERTAEAGRRAGLDVITLINEPTAAAMFFGKKNKQNRTILVYDLGGGTFDVSIMRIQNGIMDTLATDGNHHLGGVDWDEAEGFSLNCKQLNPQERGTLLLAAEDAKKILSTNDTTTIRFSYKGIHNVEITKSQFEELTKDLMKQTSKLVDTALEMAGNPKIDDVLLVGGSSRMPMVKSFIEKKFNLSPKVFEPDLAVAKGAALFASQEASTKGYVKGAIQLGSDKGSASYGIECFGLNDVLKVSNLIIMNDDLEIRKEFDQFTTRYENQTEVELAVHENRVNGVDCDMAKAGDPLEKHVLNWGKPVPKGTPIKIIVDRGKDGIIHVWAGAVGHEVKFDIHTKGVSSN